MRMRIVFIALFCALGCWGCDGGGETGDDSQVKNTKDVMSVKIIVPTVGYAFKLGFPVLKEADVHWGDGLVGKSGASMSHPYRQAQEHTVVVRATEVTDTPSFIIDDISAVEQINLPI